MAEINAVDGSDRKDWGYSPEPVTTWNGRSVRARRPDEALDCVLIHNHNSGPDYSVHAKVEVDFGGKEPQVSWGVGGSLSDNGNSVNVDVQQKPDGSISLQGSVEHNSQPENK